MAEVHIRNVVSTVRAVDGDSLLSRGVLEKIVVAVLAALAQEEQAKRSAKSDTSVTSGVAAEQENPG